MKPEQPAPNIHRISVPTPYAVGPVNCYLLDGPEPVLVDTGPATPEGEEALRAGLAALRVPIPEIGAIVLTHHHPDHAGGLGWLLAETKATVAGHRDNDLWLLDRPDLFGDRLAFFAGLYRFCGIEGDAAEAMRRRYADYDRPLSPRPIDSALHEGKALDLAGSSWQIMETPGHAGTHIALVRDDGVALVGDTLLERISSNALAEPPRPRIGAGQMAGSDRTGDRRLRDVSGQLDRPSSMLAYRKTLRRLADLPLGLLLPGHGPTFSGHAALIARRLAAQEERATRLLAGLGAGQDTVLALAYFLFPSLPDGQLFLGISEVLGHLDILEEQGRVTHSGGSPARYRVA